MPRNFLKCLLKVNVDKDIMKIKFYELMRIICWKIEDIIDVIYPNNQIDISNYWQNKLIEQHIIKTENTFKLKSRKRGV